MRSALLFDLDETLVVEEPAAVAAFEATARLATDADPVALAPARTRARELWYATPVHGYSGRIGIASWEGLWCRFDGDDPELRWLRDWAPEYRCEAWRLALAEQGIDDVALAARLGERSTAERRARHEVFADVIPALRRLRDGYTLGRSSTRSPSSAATARS